jgi:hypothetical protein
MGFGRLLVSAAAGWAAIAFILALILWGLVTPWGRALDFANFYDIGHKALLGEYDTLYDHTALIGGQEPLGKMKYVSPPITSLFFMPLPLMSPLMATFWFKLLGAVSAVAALVLLYRQIRPIAEPKAEFFALFALASAAWQPLWTFMRVGGQTTPIIFLLLAIGHATYLRRQMVATALLFSLIVLIKPVFAPIAILLFFTSGNRFRITALLAAAVSIVASLMIFGWGPHADFFQALGAQGDRLLEPWMNSSPISWIIPLMVNIDHYGDLGAMPVWAAVVLNAVRLALAAVLVAVMIGQLRAPLPDRARQHAVYVTGLLLVIAVSPVIWAHYMMILFPLIAVLTAGRPELPRIMHGVLALTLVLGLYQSFIVMNQVQKRVGFDTNGEAIIFGLLKSLPAILLCGLWILGRRPIVRILARPAWSSVAA